MKYLVTLAHIENSGSSDVKTMLQIAERAALPTLETLARWEREKKAFGGCPAGARECCFVLEAASNEEAGELIHQLPLWPHVTATVRPLESFEFRLTQDRKLLNEARKHL